MHNEKVESKRERTFKIYHSPRHVHIDDHDWVRMQLSLIHERYRLKLAYLYSEKFFFAFHQSKSSEIKRANIARKIANNFLRDLVDKIIQQPGSHSAS